MLLQNLQNVFLDVKINSIIRIYEILNSRNQTIISSLSCSYLLIYCLDTRVLEYFNEGKQISQKIKLKLQKNHAEWMH